jgi:hypothetical protein
MGERWEPPLWPGQYRPHTLTPGCWCTFGQRGVDCHVTMMLAEIPGWLPQPAGDGRPPF